MGARVSFEVERVVETFAARRAQIALDIAVTLDVPVEQALQWKRLAADAAAELVLASPHPYNVTAIVHVRLRPTPSVRGADPL